MKRKLLFFVMLFSFSLVSYSQNSNGCADGLVPCGRNNECLVPMECGRNPPPPGLVVPIDSNLYLLLAAGLSLGIYFFGFQKKRILGFKRLPKIKK